MSSAVAARWLAVIALLFGVTHARAERRPVAVINLDMSGAAAPATLSADIERELAVHAVLRAIQDSSDAAALRDRIDDEDTARLERARQDLREAEAAIRDFRWLEAIRYTEEAQRELLVVTPAVAVKLYANLALVMGESLFKENRLDAAKAAFAHARALDPTSTIDPRFKGPDLVAVFEATKQPAGTPGRIEIKGSGLVWIDGTEVGVAPGTFDASAGSHVVWLTGVDRETRGLQVVVQSGQTAVADVPDAEVPRRMKVQRARQALARAPDPTARAAAMKRLAELVGVKDAVLLSLTNEKVIFQTWSEHPTVPILGFSAHQERKEQKPADMLVRLAPPPVVEDPPLIIIPDPPPVRKWYQKRTWQLGIAGVVVGAVVGGYFIKQAMPTSLVNDSDVGIATPEPTRR
ncbi:MAG: hypothetical protein SFX73_08200 [Kofleriaceae bacterium]|nr:hypothetical protein [Kofleriaceae bacterium]